MKKLNENELKNVNGGISKLAIVGIVGAAITFIVGVIDGYVRPTKCNFKTK